MSTVTGSNVEISNFGASSISSTRNQGQVFSTLAEIQQTTVLAEQPIYRGVVGGNFVYKVGSPPAGATNVVIIGTEPAE